MISETRWVQKKKKLQFCISYQLLEQSHVNRFLKLLPRLTWKPTGKPRVISKYKGADVDFRSVQPPSLWEVAGMWLMLVMELMPVLKLHL